MKIKEKLVMLRVDLPEEWLKRSMLPHLIEIMLCVLYKGKTRLVNFI
jgi:hypothetical protein